MPRAYIAFLYLCINGKKFVYIFLMSVHVWGCSMGLATCERISKGSWQIGNKRFWCKKLWNSHMQSSWEIQSSHYEKHEKLSMDFKCSLHQNKHLFFSCCGDSWRTPTCVLPTGLCFCFWDKAGMWVPRQLSQRDNPEWDNSGPPWFFSLLLLGLASCWDSYFCSFEAFRERPRRGDLKFCWAVSCARQDVVPARLTDMHWLARSSA